MRERYVAAIDQGTASSRCLVFDRSGASCRSPRRSTSTSIPKPGWVEHDPRGDLAQRRVEVADRALAEARLRRLRPRRARASPTSARRPWSGTARPGRPCTTRSSGRTRAPTTSSASSAARHGDARFRERSGLPPATYFSGPKLRWLLDTVPGLRERAEAGEVLFGTMDSWLIWKLTGRHLTDVTNASRTMMMGLHTLDWDDELLDALGVPRAMLPEIRPSAEVYGDAGGRSPACRSPRRSATSRRRCSARRASPRARPSARTAPAASCCSTPGERPVRLRQRPADHARLPHRRRGRRPTRWRGRSRSPARSCSGFATTSA